MRVRRSIWTFLIVLFVPAALAAQEAKDTDDFTAYVEQLRSWGMTEAARMSLYTLACVQSGISVFMVQKDDSSGVYRFGYRGTSCPKPDMSEAERQELLKEQDSKINPFVERMRSIADTDKSGFVTTEEAQLFRAVVEFGYQAFHVVKAEAHDMQRLCRGLSMTEKQIRERETQYKELLPKARAAGLDLPDLDI